MTQFLMPNHSPTPVNFPAASIRAPVDDTSCWIFCYAWHADRPGGDKERVRRAAVDERPVPLSRREHVDRSDRMRRRKAGFIDIRGILEQDRAIADRTRALLAVQADLGAARSREAALAAVRDAAEGGVPQGVNAPGARRVRSGELRGQAVPA